MQNIILGHLLDKYENSEHLMKPGKSRRRVMLNVEHWKRDFPEYDFENANIRDAYNDAAKMLEAAGLVSVEWRDRKQLVIGCISLNLDRVSQCYEKTGRANPKTTAKQTVQLIRRKLCEVSVPWIVQWREKVCAEAETKYQIPRFCQKDNQALEDILNALVTFDALHGEAIAERSFSIRCYHNSKYFEQNVRKNFLAIAEKYWDEMQELMEQETVGFREELTFLGIYPRPELYEFAGSGTLETKYGSVVLESLGPYGMALPSTAVDGVVQFDFSHVSRILFIENKTNYDEYILSERCPGELVVYQGGFLSPQRRKFFEKLAASAKEEIAMCFWADIDLGGFRMFEQLQKCVPNLEPWRMTEEDVRTYRSRGLKRSESYLEQVRRALETNRFPLFQGALEKILFYGVTIEQEVFLSESAKTVCC